MHRELLMGHALAIAALSEARYRRDYAAGVFHDAEARMDFTVARVLLRDWLGMGSSDDDTLGLEQTAQGILHNMEWKLLPERD